jgi:LPS-assembly protein
MSERGIQINGQYRYLYENGHGEIQAGFLNSDDLRNDGDDINPFYGEDRKHFTFEHTSTFMSRWSNDIDYNYVSDDAYLEDFGSNLSLASTTHLNRRFNLRYGGENWRFTGRLQGYQTITDAEKPYQRLPQLILEGNFPDQALGLSYGLRTEYTDFDHDELVDGQRFDIEPSVSLPLQTASTFFTPRVAVKHTQYRLDENDATITDDSPSRTLPIVSVDSGVFFEREMMFAGSDYIQTLEPRAFYLYIPERNQVDIPVFDSSLRTFNFGQLFSYDRFSGTDRIGDANQLSLAVTSRVLDAQSGREKFRASLGQIKYFRDRDVVLPNGTEGTRSGSDYVAEVAAEVAKNWTARGEIQWGQNWDASNFSAVQVRYRSDDGKILNLSHRYRRDGVSTLEGLEQVDVSGRLPLNKQWSVVGRYYRSIRDGELLEGLAGVEYQSCCWSTRLVVRDYINDVSDEDRNLAILLQIELKGLGNFGQKTDSLLEKSILGFDPD